MSSSNTPTTQRNAVATLNILNLLAYIANVGLVNGVPSLMNLPDNAEVSSKYQTLVTPAGWAFAIWGLIFLVQAIWSIVQIAVPSARSNPLVVRGVGYHYLVVCAVQVAWTFAFGLEQIAMSMVWMLAILYYLFRIYVSQEAVLQEDESEIEGVSYSTNYWLYRFPFGLHLGWIVAATLVNANLVLVAYDVSTSTRFGSAIATVIIALSVAALTLYKEYKKEHPNVVIPFVLVWALNAISKELNNPKDLISSTYSTEQIETIQNGAFASAMLILSATIVVVIRAGWKRHTEQANRPEADALLNEDEQQQ